MGIAQVQPLESRTLMSATAAVTADRAEVRADLFKFRADAFAGTATLVRDTVALRADGLAGATTVVPAVAQLRADVKAMDATLKGDRLTEGQAVLGDESTILLGLRQLRLDHGNATAEAADHAALKADRAKLETDEVAGLDSRIATRTAAQQTVFNDVSAIEAAAATDPNASASLKAAVAQFGDDRTAKLTTLSADLAKLSADRAQLAADLTAAAAAS